MGPKRKVRFRDDDEQNASSKRQRSENSYVGPHQRATQHSSSSSNARRDQQRDEATGPGGLSLDGWANPPEDHESTEEATAYLRSVRSEADALPYFKTIVKSEGSGGENGKKDIYYSRGAFVAHPDDKNAEGKSFLFFRWYCGNSANWRRTVTVAAAATSAKQVYTLKALSNFSQLQYAIAAARARIPIESRNLMHPYVHVKPYSKAYQQFRQNILPQSAQLARLAATPTATLFNMLFCASKLIKKDQPISRNLALWIWALLASVPEVGTLSNDDVFVVRSTAKAAVRATSYWAKKGTLKAKILEDMVEDHVSVGTSEGDEPNVTTKAEEQDGDKMEVEADQVAENNADAGKETSGADGALSSEKEAEGETITGTDEAIRDKIDHVSKEAAVVVATEVVEAIHDETEHLSEEGEVEGALTDEGAVGEQGDGMKVLPDLHTRTALFNFITIAGQVFGQMDLMEYLEQW